MVHNFLRIEVFFHLLSGISSVFLNGIFSKIQKIYIETERKDHAHDFARDSLPVGEYDGIITVSGDGLMWEVINGIMLRPDWYKLIKTPIGIIPAGSGNAMGSYLRSLDYFTAAMNIIKGYHRPLDLWRVKQKDRLEWGFVVLAWCMVSDVAMEAENRRWMGSIRFDFGALLSIARFKLFFFTPNKFFLTFFHRRYPGRLSFLPIENFAKNRCSPHFGECPHCLPKISLENVKDEEIILQSKITHTDYANPPPNWKVIKDEFVWFTCGNTTHLKPDMVGFPFAHIGFYRIYIYIYIHFLFITKKNHNSKLGDGSLDLVFCRKGVQDIGRTELLKLFSKFENGEFVEHQAVEYYKAQAFVLEPLSKEGTFMLDGEPIAYETVTCENFQGLGNVFCKPPKLI